MNRPPETAPAHLIELAFTSRRESADSFREAFFEFVKTYCTRPQEEADLFWLPVEERAVHALAHVFSEAVSFGELAPLRVPFHRTAFMVLTNLTMLKQQVARGFLTPVEAADLLTSLLFEGLQV